MAEEKYTDIKIPTDIAKALNDRAKNAGFPSVSSYVTYILRQVLSNVKEKKEELTEKDKIKVREELKAMGYIQ